MKILGRSLLAIAALLGSLGTAGASQAQLRQAARTVAKQFIATHGIPGATKTSIRVAFQPGGRVQTSIYGKLIAKGRGGTPVVTSTRFALYRVTFKASGNKLTKLGHWKAQSHPVF